MFGYVFEVTNTKTGKKYIGEKYAVAFDKDYLGEEIDERLVLDIQKYGRPAFEVKMIDVGETKIAVDELYDLARKQYEEELKNKGPAPEESSVESEPVAVKKTTKRGRKKVTEEE